MNDNFLSIVLLSNLSNNVKSGSGINHSLLDVGITHDIEMPEGRVNMTVPTNVVVNQHAVFGVEKHENQWSITQFETPHHSEDSITMYGSSLSNVIQVSKVACLKSQDSVPDRKLIESIATNAESTHVKVQKSAPRDHSRVPLVTMDRPHQRIVNWMSDTLDNANNQLLINSERTEWSCSTVTDASVTVMA